MNSQKDWIIYDHYRGHLWCLAIENTGKGWKLLEWVNFQMLSRNKLRKMIDMGYWTMISAARSRDKYTYVIGDYSFNPKDIGDYWKGLVGKKFNGKHSVSIDIDKAEFERQVGELLKAHDIIYMTGG